MCLQKPSDRQSLLCSSSSYNVSTDRRNADSRMADRRKLQGEIDRCLKKVTEGVEIFQDLWQKVQSATNCNTKEKHEADLKKEIKKLQRLRDGIKTWLQASEIKDKKPLVDAKKLIEMQMEQFKIIERETKTKAYSKEGLGAATKVDPKEKEKEDIITWLSHSIDELNVQIDQFESEIENVAARKKKLDRDKQDQVEVFRNSLEKHRYHIDKLETIMRLVDNDVLQLGQISSVREDVEHYIRSCRDPDFEENEFLYEDLKLEEACAALGSKLAAMSVHDNDDHGSNVSDLSLQNSSSPSPSPSLATHSKDLQEEDGRTRFRSQSEEMNHSCRSSGAPLNRQNSLVNSHGTGSSSISSVGSCSSSGKASQSPSVWQQAASSFSSGPILQVSVSTTVTTQSSIQNYAQAASANHSGSNFTPDRSLRSLQSTTPVASSHTTTTTTITATTTATTARTASSSAGVTLLKSSPSVSSTQTLLSPPAAIAMLSPETNLSPESIQQLASGRLSPQLILQSNSSSSSSGLQHLFSSQLPQLQQQQQQASSSTLSIVDGKMSVNGPASGASALLQITPGSDVPFGTTKPVPQQATPSDLSSSVFSTQASLFVNVSLSRGTSYSSMSSSASPRLYQQTPAALQSFPHSSGRSHTPAATTIYLDPILGVAPLGPQPLDRERSLQLAMLDAASRHPPLPMDSQQVSSYLPPSPCSMPPYYTQLHPSVADSPEFFQRLQPESLFFVFYYMEGTKAQSLAAKALKQLSWRFHTKFLMWFQRHEEPKVITEDFEQGTYIYFDYEKWVQRKKEGFVFEYKFLEDLN